MIVVRDIFRLNCGKTKEALALWREGRETLKSLGHLPDRMLADLTGACYTLIFEFSYNNFSDLQQSLPSIFSDEKYKQWFQKFIPLTQTGYREVVRVAE